MKIVLVTFSLDPERGAGTAERTRRLAVHLADLGSKCSIIASAGTTWLHELEEAGVEVYLTGHIGGRFPVPLPYRARIWRMVHDADVIYVTGYWYLLAVFVCFMARIARKPFALCPAGELTPLYRKTLLKKSFYWLFGRTMITSAASIIATTARERDEIVRIDGVPPARVMISPNGIAPLTVTKNCNITLPSSPFILFLGRLTPVKGPDLLVDAFAKISTSIPGIRLVIAGPDCGMRSALEARVHILGIGGRVTFLGFVDESTRQHLYRRAAFLVIPSRSEVMSMVALEAAAMGTPVLLTDRCGFEEVQEVGGGLVVSADIADLAGGMATMLNETSNLRLMGERLRNFVLTRYAWTTVAAHLQGHLAEVARSARPCS
jgi:glycosyltransferase involved in cell wall biosynthesis